MKPTKPFLYIVMCLSTLVMACEQEETVTLEGEVTYDDYAEGVIRIRACESTSSSRTGQGDISTQHPGKCVADTVLESPGPFSFKVTMTWAGTQPDIDLMAFLQESVDSPQGECTAGAMKALPLHDHQDIALVLEKDYCPGRY